MNPRNTFYWWFSLAGFSLSFSFFERHRSFAPPPPAKLLPGLKAWAVNGIQVQFKGQEEIRAERTNEAWLMTRPVSYPAQSIAVDNLLRALQEVEPQNHISAQELRGNHNVNAEYGFETPYATLVIQQGEEQRQLKLGNLTAPGNQIYAQVVGSEGVDIIGTSVLQFIPRQPSDWRDRMLVNLHGQLFDHISVVSGAKSFALQNDGTNASWYMTPHDRVNIARLSRLFNDLQILQISEFVTDSPNADFESFGLQPPELELSFDKGTNHLLKLQFGKSPTNDLSQVYVRRDGQSAVVLVPGAQVARWREKGEFRDRTLAGMYTWLPDEIEVKGHENYTVRRVTNDIWQVVAPYEFPADTNLMKLLISRLARMEVVPTNGPVAVKDIVPPSEWTNYGLAPPNWKFILKQNRTNALSGTSNTVMAEVDFGAVATNNTVYARRPEEPSVYAVALADFQKLNLSGIQLRERQIWNFKEDQVSRITIREDGKPMVLEHRGANSWAIPAGSQGNVNPLAVEVGAQELGVLAAENFAERGDQNRVALGFSDKSLQFTVSLTREGKAETLSFELGGWSPRQLRYGLVELDGRKWIFELSAVVYDRLMYCFSLHEDYAGAATNGAAAAKPAVNSSAK